MIYRLGSKHVERILNKFLTSFTADIFDFENSCKMFRKLLYYLIILNYKKIIEKLLIMPKSTFKRFRKVEYVLISNINFFLATFSKVVFKNVYLNKKCFFFRIFTKHKRNIKFAFFHFWPTLYIFFCALLKYNNHPGFWYHQQLLNHSSSLTSPDMITVSFLMTFWFCNHFESIYVKHFGCSRLIENQF